MKQILIVVFAAALLYIVLAQSSTAQTQLALEPGANGSLNISDLETVNLYNGALGVRIPYHTVGGRGEGSYTATLGLEMKWDVEYSDFSPERLAIRGTLPFESQPGWMEYQQEIYGSTSLKIWFNFRMPDGREIYLRDTATLGQVRHQGISRGQTFATTGNEGVTFVCDYEIVGTLNLPPEYWHNLATGYLRFRDGTFYRIEDGMVKWISDRNGNKIQFTYGLVQIYETTGPTLVLTKITDALNREIEYEYRVQEGEPYGLCDRIKYKGWGAGVKYVRQCFGSGTLRPDLTPMTPQQRFPQISGLSNTHGTGTMGLNSIWLPNGKRYRLYYNQYGEVARLELPTGVAYEYDFAAGLVGGYSSGVIKVPSGSSHSPPRKKIYRRLIERREYPNGGTGNNYTRKTTYSRPESVSHPDNTTGSNLGYVDVKQLDANDVTLTHSRAHFYGSARQSLEPNPPGIYYPGWTDGLQYKIESLANDGSSILRRETSVWQQKGPVWWWGGNPIDAPANDPRIIERTVELLDVFPSLVSKTTSIDPNNPSNIGYDQYNNPTDVWFFDYGSGQPGAFLKREHIDYVIDSNYTNIYLRSLPSHTWTSSDIAGNNKVSRTQFEYDNYNTDTNHAVLVSRSSVAGHDSTNYGSSNIRRGNVTAVTSYADAQAQTGATTIYSQYDILGNVVKMIDANGNASTLGYSDNFGGPDNNATTNTSPSQLSGLSTFAFPTSTTNPMGWTGYVQYDYFIGAPVNTQDINGLTSKTIYNDEFGRPTQTVAAIGTANEIQSSIIYDDANRRIEQISDLNALNDNGIKSESFYDGLGREVEARSYKDGGYTTVKTEYDALSRVEQLSNPYRPHLSETAVWTKLKYDALGRAIEIETPDGANVKTAFDGNRTLVTDQAGKHRISKTNAMGLLTDIWEIVAASDTDTISVTFPAPNGTGISYGYLTEYTYDTLGNLTLVEQGVQEREFAYNSLSQLLSATNGESGTVSYIYDEGGNLKTKRDARGIKTIYDYDALNRPTERCYRVIGTGSLGMTTCANNNETAEPNTGDVNYTYENTSVTNLKGVLTKVTNDVSTTEYVGFDSTGRVIRSKQTTDGVVYGVDTNPMTYAYNLSGALIEQKYPSGRVVKNVLDNDGDLSMVQSKKNQNFGHHTYVSNITYNAASGVTSLQLGNGKWESTQFNSRLQPTQIALGTVQNGTDKLKLDYEYGALNLGTGATIAGTNNGNVSRQKITVPTVGQSPGFTAQQYYAYDSLNRIQIASENIETPSEPIQFSWRQQFTYDRYGNRNFDEANTSTLPKNCNGNTTVCPADVPIVNPSVNTADNRLNGYTFDSSGNTTRDAQFRKFTYDGENKQIRVETINSGGTVIGTIGEYVYDGQDKRVKKKGYTNNVLTEETIFVYDAAGKLVAEYSTDVASVNNAKVAYLTNDHLGSPRITTDKDGNVAARHDYHPFGEEIGTLSPPYNGSTHRTAILGYRADTIRKQFTGYERDNETELDFAQARYYLNVLGRFTSTDPIQITADRLHDPQQLGRFIYARNNPLFYVDKDGKEIRVTNAAGRHLFVLDDGQKKVTTMTAREVYDKGIQWFEPEANNYMKLLSVATDIGTIEGIKHFTWDQIAEFAEVDRYSSSFRSGGSGDWKVSKEGADGYFLVTVGGMPYWNDAIGQIPFAVDTYRSYLESNGNPVEAVKQTLATGQQHAGGDVQSGQQVDKSNNYDNYMILRGAIWASERYKMSGSKTFLGSQILRRNSAFGPKYLADTITSGSARDYGLK